ncbi:MAG: hypothetical protein JWN84_3084 [Nocardioides sp.]|nr:hypothetical protein [Nocardioides sp.]
MDSTRTAAGTLVLRLDAPTPSVLLLVVRDAAGRVVARRRLRDLRVAIVLHAGDYDLAVSDERSLHDPARHAPADLAVTVTDGELVRATATLTRGGVVRVRTAAWSRLGLVHTDGERLEAVADGRGRAVLAGLRPGSWTAVAHDNRRVLVSAPVDVRVAPGAAAEVDLPLQTLTSQLLVDVRGTDRRPVLAPEVHVTDTTGRTVVATVRSGLADVRDLRPGPVRVVVPPSVGHRGTHLDVVVEPGALTTVQAVVPVGAALTGRVLQAGSRQGFQYAAVVALLDGDGVEVERVRTDEHGRFALGRGLTSTNGLTIVATSGPETLHVTRAAVADVCVLTGVRHDLGDIVLPVAGRGAVWTARTPAVAGMKLPSTRV